MSIWGKIVGGFAGLMLGGPLGALLGVAAGHAVDRFRADAPDVERLGGPSGFSGGGGFGGAAKQTAFTVAVIVLGAKMAKADGVVSRAEVEAFKQVFHIPPSEMGTVGRIFDAAKRDAGGFEPYARQVAWMFKSEPAVLEELLGGLFHIANADGHIHPAELQYLRRVADIFGLDGHAFERVRSIVAGPAEADPYEILGVPRTASDDQVKKAYRKLIRENHPDTLIAQGLPQEFIDLANEKMAGINAAYDRVEKERGLK